MIIQMLTKGAVLIGGLMATQAVLDKVEKAVNNREARIKKENSEEREREIKEEEDYYDDVRTRAEEAIERNRQRQSI